MKIKKGDQIFLTLFIYNAGTRRIPKDIDFS